MVPLREMLKHRKEFIEINNFEIYKRCRVQLHAQGIVLRDQVLGAEIKTKKQQVCKAGEFLVAEIDAKLGGYGIVPPDLEGAIVSSHYFLFGLNERKLDQQFLRCFVKTPAFFDQVLAQGSTNYAAIRPGHVLEYKIPLPSLREQRQLVERIEALAVKIEEADRLREEASQRALALSRRMTSVLFKPLAGTCPSKPLDQVSTRITKGESPAWQGFTYEEQGAIFVRSENVLWGSLDISSTAHISEEFHKKLRRSQLRPGDVLINLVGASIGRACRVPEQIGPANINQAVGVISPKSDILDGGYLLFFLLSEDTQKTLHGGKVETARPNISLRDVSQLLIPIPFPRDQRKLVQNAESQMSKVHGLRIGQEKTKKELDALLPAILDRAFKGEL
jgi:type I restriction enzyme S subunit